MQLPGVEQAGSKPPVYGEITNLSPCGTGDGAASAPPLIVIVPDWMLIGSMPEYRTGTPSMTRDPESASPSDHQGVVATRPAVDRALDRAARLDDEDVLVVRGADQILDAGEGDVADGAGSGSRDAPAGVRRRAADRVDSRAGV